jgi:hypothetical protein
VSGSSAADVVEQGRPRRPPRPHRTARLVALGVVLLLVTPAGVLLDHRSRAREAVAVRACARAARSSVRFTDARVDAITGYVRPALDAAQDDALRRRLRRTVSVAVDPTLSDVRESLARCTDVRVLWLHRAAQAARDDCRRLLRADLRYLEAVVADGGRAFGERSLPAGRCS